MKKILIVASALLILCAEASAHGGYYVQSPRYYGYNNGYVRPHNNWVGPAIVGGIVGGAIGYGMARPYYPPVYVQPPPLYVPPQPVYVQPQYVPNNCSEWREVMNSDGTVYRERICQ